MDKRMKCVQGTVLTVLFACFWASSLIVRQSDGDVSVFAHYMSRFVEIASCVALAFAARAGHVGRTLLAGASMVLVGLYCILELVRLLVFPSVFGGIDIAVGAAVGVVNGLLVACLALLVVWDFGMFDMDGIGVIVPVALALAHGIFLLTGLFPTLSPALVKMCLLVVAAFGLGVLMPRLSGMAGQSIAPAVDFVEQPARFAGFSALLRNPEHFTLWFGMVVFPLLYGFMAQVCAAAGVSSGLFDLATEVVGIAFLLALAAMGHFWKGKFDAEGVFLVALPIFTTAMLFLPVFWDSEVFVSGFLMKCGFLVYIALMWIELLRVTLGNRCTMLFAFGIAMGLYHATLMAGRMAGSYLASNAALSFPAVSAAALVAVWVLSMAALAVVLVNRRGRSLGMRATDAYEVAFVQFARAYGLSERECAVCRDYARGRTVEYIAANLAVSQETVKTHLKRAYAKTSCHSRQDLIDKIEQQGCSQEK